MERLIQERSRMQQVDMFITFLYYMFQFRPPKAISFVSLTQLYILTTTFTKQQKIHKFVDHILYYKSELQLLLNRFGKTFETIHDAIIRDTEIAIFFFCLINSCTTSQLQPSLQHLLQKNTHVHRHDTQILLQTRYRLRNFKTFQNTTTRILISR